MSSAPGHDRRLRCHPRALRRWPHLGGFLPDWSLVGAGNATTGLVVDGLATAGHPAHWLAATEAPFRAPRFGRRHAPVAMLVAAAAAAGRRDSAVRAVLAGSADLWAEQARPGRCTGATTPADLIALLEAARVGGAPGLPDPGATALGLPRGEAVVVLDPGHGHDAARAAMLIAATRAAAGRPILLALAPDAPSTARLQPPPAGIRALPGRLAPWTLIDLAHALHGLGDETELLAAAAGVGVTCHHPGGWAGLAPARAFAALAGATRWADPFRGRPWTAVQAVAQLADWRHAEAENRRIVAATGIEWFKARSLRQSLASHAGGPLLFARGSAAIAYAARQGGAAAVWAAVMPAGLPTRAAAAGVPLVRLEDGFVRSAGLGVLLAPAASLVRDFAGIHYDPRLPSTLEQLLSGPLADPALIERAAGLRLALIARGITKYTPAGDAAGEVLRAAAGRRVVLVTGQVEDDAAMRVGGQSVRTNLGLLQAVRAAEPDAFVAFKPHPDVAAGMRPGVVPAALSARLMDHLVQAVPIAGLYRQVAAVHTIGSLSGFEALLRGLPVVTWGRPFYAGWGLTQDRDPLPPAAAGPGAVRRRWLRGWGEPLSVDGLVAAALLLYPRNRDPLTGLPCPIELLVERLAATPAQAPPRVPSVLRRIIAATSRSLAGWWAGR